MDADAEGRFLTLSTEELRRGLKSVFIFIAKEEELKQSNDSHEIASVRSQ